MAKKITTLYVDDTSLRLLVSHGNKIKKLSEVSLTLGQAKISATVKEAEAVAKVKQLFKSQKVRTKKVIVGLSGLHCLTRPITLPQLPREMLAEAVMREAKRVLPVPLEQLYISWQTTPLPEGKVQVFLAAIPRKTADTVLTTLRQAGLKPRLMDLKPLALARLAQEATAIIVDIQPTEFDIVIMADGVPQPVRTISFPGKALSQEKRMMMVTEELRRTIDFYNSNNPESPLHSDVSMFVSGELADEPNMYKLLSDELGYPVLPLPSPLKCHKPTDLSRYMVNIGLVLKELEKEAGPSVANLNILPEPYQPTPISLARITVVPGVVVVIGALVLTTVLVQEISANVSSVQNQLNKANLLIKQKQNQQKELEQSVASLEGKIAGAKASINTYTAAIGSLDKQGDLINEDLEVTVNSLPGSISLAAIDHSVDGLTIRGSSPSETEVLSYASNLDASGRFPEITIANIKRVVDEENERMNFTLVLKTGGQD